MSLPWTVDTIPAPRRVRWGLPDAFIVWFIGSIAGLFASLPWVKTKPDGTVVLTGGAPIITQLIVQSAVMLFVMYAVARWRGTGSWRRDFGLTVRLRDAAWAPLGWLFALGVGAALFPIMELADRKDAAQEVVRRFEDTSGPIFFAFAVLVVTVVPVVEELLFRGLLLRALLRRMTPGWTVAVSALIFGLVHVLGDVDSYLGLPAFVALGGLSGYLAIRRGDLSRSIFLHAGFNLATVVALAVKG